MGNSASVGEFSSHRDLEARLYSFSFVKVSIDSVSPLFIPIEVWINHILPYIDGDDKKILRESCRGFLFLISKVWKPLACVHNIQDYIEFRRRVCPGWPTRAYGLIFKDKDASQKNGKLKDKTYEWCKKKSDHEYNNTYLSYILKDRFIHLLQEITEIDSLKVFKFGTYHYDFSQDELLILPKSLTKLSLEGCSYWNNDSFQNLSQSITDLTISDSPSFNDPMCAYLPKKLKRLSLSNNDNLSGIGLRALTTTLKSLSIRGCIRFQGNLRQIGFHHRHITYLDLSGVPSIDNESVKYLPPRLKTLRMTHCRLNTSGMTLLNRKLRSLDLSCSKRMTVDIVQSVPTELKILKLSSCDSINDFSFLGKFHTSLTELDLSFCKNIATAGLANLTRLETLKLKGCPFFDSEIGQLPHNLKRLDISCCKDITDKGISYLPSGLIDLNIEYCPCITDECLNFMPRSLTQINIFGTPITTPAFLDFLDKSNIRYISGLHYEYTRRELKQELTQNSRFYSPGGKCYIQ